MSRAKTLKKLEVVLESFLERAVDIKESRLKVLDGINRLDDIAAGIRTGDELAEDVGDWFAQHNRWLNSNVLKEADRGRITNILAEIKGELGSETEATMAQGKIHDEIDRWATPEKAAPQRLILKRGPEEAHLEEAHLEEAHLGEVRPQEIVPQRDTADTIGLFKDSLVSLTAIFDEASFGRLHLLSALDETLKKATLQKNKEALILSGLLIYYLKQNGYKVEPYVSRLKEAERQLKGEK